MSKNIPNPFQNIVDPKLWKEPKNIKLNELYHYTSLDMIKLNQSFRNYRRSVFYIGGILAACLAAKVFIDGAVKQHIFGENGIIKFCQNVELGNGGTVLKMYSQNSISDYTYNRMFQRIRYLSEEPTGDDQNLNTRTELLADLGVQVPTRGLTLVPKKVPHDKYLI